jgi:hypothetical protein
MPHPLIAAKRPFPLSLSMHTGHAVAQILRTLEGARIVYRFFHGKESPRELAGSGLLGIEIVEGQLFGRIRGDLFKPTPFEFCFHRLWLTRRGLIRVVFDLAEDRSPSHRGALEAFIHCESAVDPALRRAAVVFRERYAGKRGDPAHA